MYELIFLLPILFFVFLYFYERRTLLLGFSFFLAGLFFIIALFFLVNKYEWIRDSQLIFIIGYPIIIVVAMLIIFSPVILLTVFIYNGVKLLKREGISFRNLLSLLIGMLILSYMFVFPIISKHIYKITVLHVIYVYIMLVILYIVMFSVLYTASSMFNYINIFPGKLDYIVVLGAGLNGENVTPLLASRIDKAIKIHKKHRFSKLIMSGGQGPDEVISEARAMANYAMSKGVLESDIILEDQSTNTEQNVRFSHMLMEENSKFAIVTNYYHLFRALLFARKEKIKCIGYGAKTKFYFSLNAFIREFVGYLYLSRKFHLIMIAICTVIYVILVILSYSHLIWDIPLVVE